MKSYTGKTVEEALATASQDSGTPVEELIYVLTDKTKGIFAKKVVVEVYDLSDVIKYAEDYVLSVVDNLGIESTVNTKLDDDIIRLVIDSTHNPILIGKNGKTLLASSALTKSKGLKQHIHLILCQPMKEERFITHVLECLTFVLNQSMPAHAVEFKSFTLTN